MGNVESSTPFTGIPMNNASTHSVPGTPQSNTNLARSSPAFRKTPTRRSSSRKSIRRQVSNTSSAGGGEPEARDRSTHSEFIRQPIARRKSKNTPSRRRSSSVKRTGSSSNPLKEHRPEDRPLKEADLDDIYNFIQEMKNSNDGEEMLNQFVAHQTNKSEEFSGDGSAPSGVDELFRDPPIKTITIIKDDNDSKDKAPSLPRRPTTSATA